MRCKCACAYINLLAVSIVAASLLISKSQTNFSCGQPQSRTMEGKEFWKSSPVLVKWTHYKVTMVHP